VTRITLTAPDSDSAQALLVCSQLQGVGLKTNESTIRVLNCPDNDTGQTKHQAIVIVKPTGPEEEELTYLCADPALGTENIFSLACGTIHPSRQGLSRRAVATRLPFDGASANTIGVFTGVLLQSKSALAQRMPILQAGLRQMVLEATHLAMDEQNAILNKQRAVVDAGGESSSRGRDGVAANGQTVQRRRRRPPGHQRSSSGGANDFLRRAVTQLVQVSDERYDNPSPELDDEIDRGMEMLLAALKIQSGEAPLHTLARYGY
jgi:hypothetical protein